MKSADQEPLDNSNELLIKLFDKGIIKTWYKSNDLEKMNELRNLLNMSHLTEKFNDKQYDS